MPILDYDTLKAFMHPALLDSFEEVDGEQNVTLAAAVKVAVKNYNSLTGNLPDKVVVRFDGITYSLKMALCHIYVFILHDTSYLTAITLTGLGLSENQVYDHFFKLLQAEREDLKDMRDELLKAIEKQESRYGGVIVYHGFGGPSSGNGSSRWRRG